MSHFAVLTCAAVLLIAPNLQASFSIKAESGALPAERQAVLSQVKVNDRTRFQVLNQRTTASGALSIESDLPAGLYSLKIDGFDAVDLAIEENELVQLQADGATLVIQNSPGSQLLHQYEKLRKESLARLVYPVREYIKQAKSRGANDEEIAKLTQKEVDAYQKHLQELNDFVIDDIGANIALYGTSLRWTADYRGSELMNLVDAFVSQRPDSAISKEMLSRAQALSRTAIGEIAPAISAPSLSGETDALENYRGRYVLVDFWASWCPPCRVENLHYAQLYKKAERDQFTIFAVNLDTAKSLWSRSARRDGSEWVQVSDLQGWDSKLSAAYGVTSLPASFLLDPEGRIIAKNLRGAELDTKLKELGIL